MIGQVGRLTSWEWYKLRRRWMPWVLLAVAVALAQLGPWFSYVAYHNEALQEIASGGSSSMGMTVEQDGELISLEISCAELVNGQFPAGLERLSESQRQEFLADAERFRAGSCSGTASRDTLREGFALPSAIPNAISGLFTIVTFFMLTLTASAIGNEYGWGTLRTALTGGSRRWALLLSKLLLLLLLGAAGFLIMGTTVALSSFLTSVVPPAEPGGFMGSGEWADAAIVFAKAVYGLVPYIALAALLTVLTRSSGSAMGIGMGYFVIELIVGPVLRNFERLSDLSEMLLGTHVGRWMEAVVVEVSVSGDGAAADQVPPDALQTFLVLLAYTGVFLALALWVFQRRDVTGATGS